MAPVVAFLSIGGPEMIWVFVLMLLLFGAKKLPSLARSVGESLGQFKAARDEFERELRYAELDAENESKPPKIESPKERRLDISSDAENPDHDDYDHAHHDPDHDDYAYDDYHHDGHHDDYHHDDHDPDHDQHIGDGENQDHDPDDAEHRNDIAASDTPGETTAGDRSDADTEREPSPSASNAS